MVLPSKIKANLPIQSGNSIVVSRGFENCIVLRPQSEFLKILQKLKGLNQFDPRARNFQRKMLSGSTDLELDGNGRFLIPKTMMSYAKLQDTAIIVGLGDRVEIWNPTEYEAFMSSDPEDFADMAREMFSDQNESDAQE